MKKETLIIVLLLLIALFLMTAKKPIKKLLSRGYRNNNPGNIRLTFDNTGKQTFWQGEIKGTDKDFKTFKTMSDGYRAIFVLLNSYRSKGIYTIRQIINRYAPSNENHTENYINTVSQKTGANPDNYRIVAKDDIINLVAAISFVENGIEPNINEIIEGYNKQF